MTIKRTLFSIVIVALFVACSARVSKREEACERTSDCDDKLVCVALANGGVCRPVNYNLTPTTKECVAVQCATPADCCTGWMPPQQCGQWNSQCMLYTQNPMMYPQYMQACTNYQDNCVMCDSSKFACLEDKCVLAQTCMMDTDCTFATPRCVSNQCVQCATNTDCGTKGVCSGGRCSSGCDTASQCPIFYGCTAGACVKVGCTNDRECIVFTSSPLGFCDAATKTCSTSCDKDTQCNNGVSKAIQICSSGKCVSAGCESDEECKAVLNIQPGMKAICRMKK